MRWRVVSTSEAGAWEEALAAVPGADVYHRPGYHRAFEAISDGTAHAFLATRGADSLVHPFFLRPITSVAGEPIDRPRNDVETVYGYSGPLATTEDREFLDAAWDAYHGWCREQNVVGEFTCFNPLSSNERYAARECRVAHDRETVPILLSEDSEALWTGYPSTQRNMVRKAKKAGLICTELPFGDGLSEFRALYNETMSRLDARESYYFSDDHYRLLHEALGSKLRLFIVRDGDRPVAATLIMAHGPRLHYHLSCSDFEYRKAAPSNLLLHTVALWGGSNGYEVLHLGGGRTNDPNDGLFRFKARLSKQRAPFYNGRWVHDQPAYDQLCERWLEITNTRNRPRYFLLYRLENNT